MSSNLKVNSLVPATGTEIGIGTTGGSIDFRCPATFGGNVTIGGTLTYDEVINIDSIGIVTARSGLNVQAGQLDVGSNIKLGNAGVITATTGTFSSALQVGSGANSATQKAAFLGGYTIFENTAGTGNPSITFNNDTDSGILNPAANTLAFTTGGTEKVRITSSGAVGINTTVTSATKLQVQSDGTSTTVGGNIVARFQSNGSGRDATIQLSDNVAHSATISMLSSSLIFKQSGTELSLIHI